jgi:P-type E1-E2 ATPase
VSEPAVEPELGAATAPAQQGLAEDEARRRLAERGRREPDTYTRSTASIVRANVLTPFNAILVALGVITLVFGDWRDALFLGIVVANSGIGIWQELKAKRTLDSLQALVAPHATVIRDGTPRTLGVADVVVGDLVRVEAGDQLVADGDLVASDGLTVDESILTGEARPVARAVGEEVLSGSFVVEGAGAYEVTAVGPDSYAERVTGVAKEFRHPRSPLERNLNRLLYVLIGVMVPLGTLLIVALIEQEVGVRQAVETAVAGIVTLVPEGLILLASLTFAAAAVNLARQGALAQQLNAIESLASVDVVCLDKTGTLTEPRPRVIATIPAAGISDEELRHTLGRYAASAPARNSTLTAIHESLQLPPEPPAASVPFSSSRRWSGLELTGTRFVLGAPELLAPAPGELGEAAAVEQSRGRRVVAIGTTTAPFPDDPNGGPPPVSPLGIAVLAEGIRSNARQTVDFFLDEGVELKVISGDAPETVGSIAADVGIPLRLEPKDGRTLPEEPELLAEVARMATVIGRIDPDGKRRVVEALRDQGFYVAMVGDGVNDVPALKASRLAIAQGSGTQMAKSVADVVLLTGDFATVPRMVAQGRQILRNVQRVAKLFVTKAVFAAFLILSIGLTPEEYPLLPRHLTIAASLAIGIPAFFLALAPSDGPWRTDRFLREVSRFAVPAGVAAGLGVLASYLVAKNVLDLGLEEARTVATTVLILVGLYLILVLEATSGRRSAWVGTLCLALLAAYIAVLALPALRDFFELVVPGLAAIVVIALGAFLAVAFLVLTDERFVPAPARRQLGADAPPATGPDGPDTAGGNGPGTMKP